MMALGGAWGLMMEDDGRWSRIMVERGNMEWWLMRAWGSQ
jgi:hypothetical protein